MIHFNVFFLINHLFGGTPILENLQMYFEKTGMLIPAAAGDLFTQILSREMSPPLLPEGEEYSKEELLKLGPLGGLRRLLFHTQKSTNSMLGIFCFNQQRLRYVRLHDLQTRLLRYIYKIDNNNFKVKWRLQQHAHGRASFFLFQPFSLT